jgi:hypothetical protein
MAKFEGSASEQAVIPEFPKHPVMAFRLRRIGLRPTGRLRRLWVAGTSPAMTFEI